MKLCASSPPREFRVGTNGSIVMYDCGKMHLDDDEQISLMTPSGGEYDVARKTWGFYATPSLNRRLVNNGLRAVIVRNPEDAYYVLLVEMTHEAAFHKYLEEENLTIVSWLDSDAALGRIANATKDAS